MTDCWCQRPINSVYVKYEPFEKQRNPIKEEKPEKGRQKVWVYCVHYAKSTGIQESESLYLDRLVKTDTDKSQSFALHLLASKPNYISFQVNGLIFNVFFFFPSPWKDNTKWQEHNSNLFPFQIFIPAIMFVLN